MDGKQPGNQVPPTPSRMGGQGGTGPLQMGGQGGTRPPHYELVKQETKVALRNIHAVVGTNVAPEYLKQMAYSIAMRGGTSYGHLPGPAAELLPLVIGTKGKYLRYTTENCGVDLIWHDRPTNMFLFWGPYMRVVKAMKVISHRIYIWTQRLAEAAKEATTAVAAEEALDAPEEAEEAADVEDAQAARASCHHCLSQPREKMFKCSRCQIARYCDAACQAAAWKDHKKECSAPL